MAADYWQEIYSHPPLADLARCDPSEIFDWLVIHLPASGTAIDWSRVTGDHTHRLTEGEAEPRLAASDAVLSRLGKGQRAQHGGDSLSPCGVWLDARTADSHVLAALLEIPEHHYFLAEDRTWLVVARSEGDLDVLHRMEF